MTTSQTTTFQTPTTVRMPTTADAYLTHLRDRGVERLFVNAGTDFAPIVEAYAAAPDAASRFPEVVVCAHENLAVSMAHGAHLGDGRVQAVMLHTSVGTANAVCAILNAARDRVPILLTAGRTPLYEEGPVGARDATIHWAQEMFDQAGMLREVVKWDYELRGPEQVAQVVDRAVDRALTEPAGPVYLSLPREVLAAPAPARGPLRPVALPSAPYPSPDAVDALADRLAAARLPVVVTAASGADPRTVGLLEKLATEYGIAVAESKPRHHNLSAQHPLHVGFDPQTFLPDADVLCFLDVDVPWTPATGGPADDAVVVQCGPDPHFGAYPMRSHRSDLSIVTTIHHLLEALTPALDRRRSLIDGDRAARIEELAAAARAGREALLADEAGRTGPITKVFMNWALGQVLPSDGVVVSEYWARPDLLPLTGPGSFFGTPPAGGLGWGLPAAVGLRLVRPDRTVIATVGDGAYLFANPAACHHAMAMHNAPVLTVACSNEKWGAVESSALAVYPEGDAAAAPLTPFARLRPTPSFAAYAEASGGYGERVDARADLVPALRRALHAVQVERRHAVVDVACA
jgi:acetolactate synthase I/II/III large subunit